MVFHCLNRGNDGGSLFADAGDYAAFERVLAMALARVAGVRLLAYCLMPNHWHLALWPTGDRDLAAFMHLLTTTHVRRWHRHRHTEGRGHLYQGTYKSFPVQDDGHLLWLCRYVERNALRAGLVTAAQDWRWCSLWRREHGSAGERAILADGPVDRPAGWLALVDQPQTDAEVAAVRESVRRGRPFGDPTWQRVTAERLGLQSTLRPRGRPRETAG